MLEAWKPNFLPALQSGVIKSKFEWEKLFGQPVVAKFESAGSLKRAKISDLNGLSVLLDIGEGIRSYEITTNLSENLLVPEEGGAAVPFDDNMIFLEANPEALFQSIFKQNEFEKLFSNELPKFVSVGFRDVEPSKRILLLISLDEDWLATTEFRLWMRAQKVARIIIMKSRPGLTLQDGEVTTSVVTCTFPGNVSDWKIARHLFCDATLGVSALTASKVYPEIKIIVDRTHDQIILLGTPLHVKDGVGWGNYLFGVCEMGDSPMPSDVFAQEHLDFPTGDQDSKVRNVRLDAENKIKEVFKDFPALQQKAIDLFHPKPAIPKKVSRGFTSSEIIFWPAEQPLK